MQPPTYRISCVCHFASRWRAISFGMKGRERFTANGRFESCSRKQFSDVNLYTKWFLWVFHFISLVAVRTTLWQILFAEMKNVVPEKLRNCERPVRDVTFAQFDRIRLRTRHCYRQIWNCIVSQVLAIYKNGICHLRYSCAFFWN